MYLVQYLGKVLASDPLLSVHLFNKIHPIMIDIGSIETKQINNVTYYLPKTEDDISTLLQYACQQNLKVVVRGAAHSFPLIGQEEAAPNSLFIILAYLANVNFDATTGLVNVQAGCHLGYDPFDPTGVSTVENSLLYQIDPTALDGPNKGRRIGSTGWALPDLGGISHQTVGGFMATGSSGGSVLYSFESAVVSVRIMHHGPNGVETNTYTRPTPANPDDPFYALAFAHRGLLGIVTEVVFQCEPTFDITGTETVSTPTDCSIDLFGPGDAKRLSLANFFRGLPDPQQHKGEYSRIIWWPQPGMERMVVWQANRTDPANEPAVFPVPYKEVPYIFGSPTIATAGADMIFTALGQWQSWINAFTGDDKILRDFLIETGKKLQPKIMEEILNVFVTLPTPVQPFTDVWWEILPMDNQMSDQLFPVWFTELWIPLDKTEVVMTTLRDFYADANHPERAGTFCCEIYAGRKSDFWMSPAYNTDVIRIDVFWFANNTDGTPQDYYQQFWELLAPFDFRPHWGKFLPAPDGAQGVSYLRSLYPKWDDVLTLRAQRDPYNLFLTTYWQQHLGL